MQFDLRGRLDTLQKVLGDYGSFLQTVVDEMTDAGFDMADFSQMDHMCYRVPSVERYEQKKQELTKVAQLLGEANVGGRPIATFRLHEPIRHGDWRIDAVELPTPKPGKDTPEGLEHVEMVLFDDFQTFLGKHPDKEFDMVSVDRGINPEIGFRLPTYRVKFHLLSLTTAVYLEYKLGLTDI